MNKIRLLHIAQCAGGVDCYLRMLLAHMDRNSFEQILICSNDYLKNDYELLVDSFVQMNMRNSLSFSVDIKAIKKIRNLISSYRPDVIYCHSSKAGGLGRIANIGIGIPIVYNPHGWAFNIQGSKLKCFLYLIIEKILALVTTKIIVISNYEKLVAIQKDVAKTRKMKVIFNGIDMEALNEQLTKNMISRESLCIPEGAYIIGMVGRISAQKAPGTFIKVAKRLKALIPNAYFMIVGDGDERKEVEQQIMDAGLQDKVIITGWVNNPIAYSVLFDQAVLLSRWEGFGLVLAEYMKLGKPIVATEINAIPDLITDHENGLLVEVDNVEQITAAIVELYEDHDLKMKLIKNGMMRVNAFFNVERVAGEHERLFEKMLNQRNR